MYWVRTNETTLRQVPVAYFAMCMLLQRPTVRHQQVARPYGRGAAGGARHASQRGGRFVGKLRYHKLPMLERVLFAFTACLRWSDFRD